MSNYNSSHTGTEIDRVVEHGINVSSDIQNQLNSKEPTLTKGNLTESTSSVLTLSGNINAIIGSGLSIRVKESSGSQSGYLSSTDWTTFNSKQNAITGAASTITTSDLTASRVLISNVLGKIAASSVTDTILGYLDATSSIQTQLNGKEPTLTKGNLTETTSSILTIGNGTNSVIGSGTTISVSQATTSTSGYLSNTDWSTFNNKQNAITGGATTITTSDLTASRALVSDVSGKVAVSGVTSTVLGYLDATSSVQTQLNGKEPTLTKGNLTEITSSVLTITGGTGSQIGSGTSLQVKQATTIQSGYLSSTDWNIFNNKQNTNITTDLVGTTNQVNLSSGGTDAILGSTPITLSLPQNIDTLANVNFATLNLSALTASRASIIDSSKNITHSITTSSELAYLSGTTSSVQTQLDSKQKSIYKIVASSGGDYTGLKEAIDDGATKIFIKNGTYLEATPINITTDGTEIIGENIEETIVEFGIGQDGIRVYANATKIQNLTLDANVNNSAAAYVLGDGQVAGNPDINNGNNNTLDHCIIRGGSTTFTVYVAGASYLAGTPTLQAFEANELQYNNRIENCILESTWDGDAFSFSLQKDGSISNNYCEGGRIAYYMNRDTNCVNNSIVDSVNQGIFVGCPAYGNNLNGNRIYNAVSSGIKVQNQLEHTPLLTDQRAFNNNFNENVIYLCGNTGIEVTGDINHEPKGNNFVGNTIFKPDNHGIYIQDAHFNNFNNNTIYQPRSDTGTYARGSGFYLVQNVENNNMNDNVIIDERANQLHTAIANREGTDCPNNSVIGNRIIASNSERTVWVQSNGWIISNNYVNGGYYAGIYLDGADNCNVTGNICENNTNETNNAYYEIWLNNTANNNIISNNTCISSAANVANADITVSSGTGNKIENNIGIGTTTEYATILSGLQDMGTGTGIVVQSGNTSFAKRTITGTSNQITVTNGDGVSGNPTLSVPTDFYVGAGQVGRDVNNLIDFSTNNQISFKTNNTSSQFVIDSNGNIGINTNDIEAWDSAYVAIQFHSAAIAAGSASNDLCLVNNAYNDGAMKFRSNGYAQKISLENDGSINFQISKQSGTANNTITWKNTLMIDAAGLINIENKNIGENRYGLNLTTEIEDSDNVSNGIAHFDSGGSYVSNGNTSNNQYGLHVQTYIDSTSHDGTLTNLYGIRSLTGITNSGSNGVVTNNVGYDALVYANDGGTITNSYMYRGGLYGSTPTSIVNNWGLYLTDEEKNYLSGTLGVGAEPTANIIGNFYKNQNSATILNVRNDTNDTGALSELQVRYSTQYGSIIQLSPNYTTNGLLAGNSVGVFSNNNSNGLRVFTYDATDLILGTANTPRMTISSTGVVNIANLTASKMVTTDSSKNLVTSYDVNQSLSTTSTVQFGSLLISDSTITKSGSITDNSSRRVGIYLFENNNNYASIINSDLLTNPNNSSGAIMNVAPSSDTGTIPLFRLEGRGHGTDGFSSAQGVITRPLFGLYNYTSLKFRIDKEGVVYVPSLTASKMVTTDANQNLATTYDVNQSLATTSDVQFGSLGVGVASTANIIGNFQKNQDTYTVMQVTNTNSSTTSSTGLALYTDNNQYVVVGVNSTLHATNGLITGGSVGLYSNNLPNGLRVFTYDATGLTLGTNNTSRMAINSVGAISTAFTGTNHSTNGFTSIVTDITTSSAAYYTSGLLINATTNYVTSGITNSGEYVGVNSYAFINNADHAGTLTDNFGFNTASGINACASGGTITNNYGIRCYIYNGAGTMTNSYMFRGIVGTSGGTITNNWGIYLSGCEKNYVEGSLELVGSNVFRVGTPEGSTSSDATGLFKFISYGTNQAATNVVLGVLEEDAEANTYLVRMKSGNKTFADATDRFYVNSVGIGYLSSGLGIGVEPTSYALQIQRDQNTATMAFIKNANNNAAAFSGIEIETDSHYSSWRSLSTSFTTDGLLVGDSTVLFSHQNSNGLRVFTVNETNLTLGTNNTARMTINSSGNLGFGTTDIETWNTSYRAIESVSSSIMFQTSGTADMIALLSNTYVNTSGSDIYKTTNEAIGLFMYDGLFQFRVAASGTADTAITWKTPLTVNNNGSIDISNTLDSGNGIGTLIQSNLITNSNQTAYKIGIDCRTSSSYVSSTYTESGEFIGVKTTSYIESNNHQGILGSLVGVYSDVGIETCGSGGTITNNIGVYVRVNNSDADGTITNSYFLKGAVGGSSGTITNNWGIHLSGCTKNYLAGTLDVVGGYKINGTDGVSFSGAVTNITVVNGIVTAAS